MTEMRLIDLPELAAREWLRDSLLQGHEISAAMLSSGRIDTGRLAAIIPADTDSDRRTKFETGGLVPGSSGTLAEEKLVIDLVARGARCVVIEDELAERTDPWIERTRIESAFIGDRVVHWHELTPKSGADACAAVKTRSSGYPTNAFVTTTTAAELELSRGQALSDVFASSVVRSTIAVLVAAYDAESFVVWDERVVSLRRK